MRVLEEEVRMALHSANLACIPVGAGGGMRMHGGYESVVEFLADCYGKIPAGTKRATAFERSLGTAFIDAVSLPAREFVRRGGTADNALYVIARISAYDQLARIIPAFARAVLTRVEADLLLHTILSVLKGGRSTYIKRFLPELVRCDNFSAPFLSEAFLMEVETGADWDECVARYAQAIQRLSQNLSVYDAPHVSQYYKQLAKRPRAPRRGRAASSP